MHARKMTATLQEATSSRFPVLLRVDKDTGHNEGTMPVETYRDINTDIYTFIKSVLN